MKSKTYEEDEAETAEHLLDTPGSGSLSTLCPCSFMLCSQG